MKSIIKYNTMMVFIIIFFILFPEYAFASGMEGLPFVFIFCPFLVICINFGKYLYLKPHKELKNTFGTFVGVVITEIILISLCHWPVVLLMLFLSLITGIEGFRISESLEDIGLILMGVSYGIMAIVPNLFLLKEEGQSFINTLKIPKKIIRATILAFIFPTITVIVIYILVT